MNIKIKNVSKKYHLGQTWVHALQEVSFDVKQGEFLALTGPSGSGKSTLLHLLGALDQPSSGEIWMNEQCLKDLDDDALALLRRDKIGFIFQSFNLIPVLSVFGNVEFPLLLQKVAKKERKERVLDVLNKVGLSERAHHKTEELSGGQRQRVAIARALVTEPALLISDEPTANLDSKTGYEIIELMEKLNQDHQLTLLFATHDAKIVAQAHRHLHILDGRIVEDATGEQSRNNAHRLNRQTNQEQTTAITA